MNQPTNEDIKAAAAAIKEAPKPKPGPGEVKGGGTGRHVPPEFRVRPPRHVLEQRLARKWPKYRKRLSEELVRAGAKVAARRLSNQRLYELLGV